MGQFFTTLRNAIDRNIAGLFALTVAAAVLLFVPQIADIWWKLPYRVGGRDAGPALGFWVFVISIALGYFVVWLTLVRFTDEAVPVGTASKQTFPYILGLACLLVAGLAMPHMAMLWDDLYGAASGAQIARLVVLPVLVVLYLVSWLVLLWPHDSAWVLPGWMSRSVQWLMPYLLPRQLSPTMLGKGRFAVRLLIWLALPITLFSLVLLGGGWLLSGFWVSWLCRLPRGALRAIACILALLTLMAGWQWSISRTGGPATPAPYPVALAIWGQILPLLFIAGVWVAGVMRSGNPGPAGVLTGRVLCLMLTTTLCGELLWLAAFFWPELISYRLYTIWAAFHLGFGLLALGTLADSWHLTIMTAPVRQLVLGALVLILIFFLKPTHLAPTGQIEADRKEGLGPNWYELAWNRLETMRKEKGEGPVIIVAASGGGSRAALFTALVLHGLAREPFAMAGPDGPVWADRIFLISSVSGGSLATAHALFGNPPLQELADEASLQNSFKLDLLTRFGEEYEELSHYYDDPDAAVPRRHQPFDQLLHGKDPALRRIIGSVPADDMCTDFMAPILRGVLTLGLERGQSLSAFWQQRLRWPDHDNLQHDPHHPLVIFNATDARQGSRFVIGFPQLPRRAFVARRTPPSMLSTEGEIRADDPRDPVRNHPGKIHTITMRKGMEYTIDLERREAKGLDPYLRIENAAGKELGADDDHGGDLNARLVFVPPANGTYKAFATTYDGSVGRYALKVRLGRTDVRPPEGDDDGEPKPGTVYTQSLSDFWPVYRISLSEAVRASANFPWGYESCYLSKKHRSYDFQEAKLTEVLRRHASDLRSLLPRELNLFALEGELQGTLEIDDILDKRLKGDLDRFEKKFLREAPAKVPAAENIAETRNLIVQHLEMVRTDPHAPPARRVLAGAILGEFDQLVPAEKARNDEQDVYLLDGGVNDNTGIATIVEYLEHLDWVSQSRDPLVSGEDQERARKILHRLRTWGVIFLEIDSGAKPKTDLVHELKLPLQGIDNANYANAFLSRERHLRRIKRLLEPGPAEFAAGGASTVAAAQPSQKALAWTLHHQFLCNHSSDRDVMTAWALGPRDKARVMATYYWEYQAWRKLQSAEEMQDWISWRAAGLRPPIQPKDSKKQPVAATKSLADYSERVWANERKHLKIQTDILRDQKMRLGR